MVRLEAVAFLTLHVNASRCANFASSHQMNSTLGASALNAQQPLDVLRMGYMMVQVSNGTPRKGDPVFIWVAATAGANVQGSVRTSASAGNTAAITNAFFNGPADASGVAEIVVRL